MKGRVNKLLLVTVFFGLFLALISNNLWSGVYVGDGEYRVSHPVDFEFEFRNLYFRDTEHPTFAPLLDSDYSNDAVFGIEILSHFDKEKIWIKMPHDALKALLVIYGVEERPQLIIGKEFSYNTDVYDAQTVAVALKAHLAEAGFDDWVDDGDEE